MSKKNKNNKEKQNKNILLILLILVVLIAISIIAVFWIKNSDKKEAAGNNKPETPPLQVSNAKKIDSVA